MKLISLISALAVATIAFLSTPAQAGTPYKLSATLDAPSGPTWIAPAESFRLVPTTVELVRATARAYQSAPDASEWSGAGYYSFTSGKGSAIIMHPITKITHLFGGKFSFDVDGFGGTTVGQGASALVGVLANVKFKVADNVSAALGFGGSFGHKIDFGIGGSILVKF